MNSDKIILDLCGGTGAWSRPYVEAGYDVRIITLPEYDVRTYEPPEQVYGVLAAPPCTMFSVARQHTAKTPRDYAAGMEIIDACLHIIWKCMARDRSLKFWALENPGSGYLRYFLGKPALTLQPLDFGDTHSKKTSLWGHFKAPRRNPVRLEFGATYAGARGFEQFRGRQLPDGYILPPDMDRRQAIRSITPPGFARAFMEANK